MPLLIGRRLLPIEPKQGSSPAELHATVWFRNAHQSLHVPCPGLRRRMCAIDPPSFLLAVLLLLPIPDQRNFVPADCTVAAAAQQASFSANRTWRHQGGGRWRAQHVQVLGQKRGPATACDHLARSLARSLVLGGPDRHLPAGTKSLSRPAPFLMSCLPSSSLSSGGT